MRRGPYTGGMPIPSRYSAHLASLAENSMLRTLPDLEQREGAFVRVRGRTMLNLSSNDYLGMAGDARLFDSFYCELGRLQAEERKAGVEAAIGGYSGAGCSSRLLSGNTSDLNALEREIAKAYGGREEVLFFSSGYHANIGILPAMCGRRDVIFADKLCHASMIDGFRLSGAKLLRFRHNDCEHLESLLQRERSNYDAAFIATESVFSMDGDLADLERLVELKNRHDAMLYLDEAHAVGVFGEHGLGLAEQCGLADEIELLIGTFGKALAAQGAFVRTTPTVKQFLINTARSFIFTTAAPPVVVNWCRHTFQRMLDMAEQRRHLAEISNRLRNAISESGYTTRGASQIVPILTGDAESAIHLSEQLRDAGYFVLPIRPPTVPEGEARVRLSLSAAMQWEDLSDLPGVLAKASAK